MQRGSQEGGGRRGAYSGLERTREKQSGSSEDDEEAWTLLEGNHAKRRDWQQRASCDVVVVVCGCCVRSWFCLGIVH